MGTGFKIGSATIGTLGVVGLIAFLIFKFFSLRADKAGLEWMLAAQDAKVDTIEVVVEYSVPETVFVSRVRYDTTEGRIDTVYEDIPTISGSIEIDTTAELGPESNPVEVRVWGRFWYPEEYSHRNRLLIHPVVGKLPYLPPSARSPKSWGMGLVYIRSVNVATGNDYFGASVSYKRLNLAVAYDPWRKGATGVIGVRVLKF